ncbi:SDR family oxidoreductase [Candidatus Roseilinea sp. NK_OTU-006]|nr:NAD(P)H-binding protein [Candidatus Roseilinea sp. NK_OTU-006]
MTILITGANGYVAEHTLRQLRALAQQDAGANLHVRGLVRNPARADKVRALGAEPIIGDVTNLASLVQAMAGVEKVIHLAAVNRDRGEVTMERVNAQGTINVVEAAKQAGVKHIINLVGLGADPKRPYPLAYTQGRGVEAIISSGIPYTILEASVIFGPGDEFLNTLAGLARLPPFMIVPGDGQTKFQPIAVQDVAVCLVQSLSRPEVINRRLQICGSEVITLEGIIDAILAEMGVKRIKLHMPVFLLKPAVALMDALLPKPPVTPSLLAQLGVDNVATDNATTKVFGIEPIKLRAGISFVREMSFGKLMARTFGRAEYR